MTPEFLVEAMKKHEDDGRILTVTNPLPDDANPIEVMRHATKELCLVVESAEWEGGNAEIEPPQVTVHFRDASVVAKPSKSGKARLKDVANTRSK